MKSLNVLQAYLTVAASILGVETRQAAWIGSAVLKSNPWNTAFEVRSTCVRFLLVFMVLSDSPRLQSSPHPCLSVHRILSGIQPISPCQTICPIKRRSPQLWLPGTPYLHRSDRHFKGTRQATLRSISYRNRDNLCTG